MKLIYVDETERFVRIQREYDRKWNLMNPQGNILSPNMWFSYVGWFMNGFAIVQRKDRQWNFIDKDGNILSPKRWFTAVGLFFNGLAFIQREDKLWNFIDAKGCIISNIWFKSVSMFTNRFTKVQRREDDKWNFIDKQGNIMSPNIWFERAMIYKDSFIGIINNQPYYLGKDSNPHNILLNNYAYNCFHTS